jgi:hypothetical protein
MRRENVSMICINLGAASKAVFPKNIRTENGILVPAIAMNEFSPPIIDWLEPIRFVCRAKEIGVIH